MLQFFKNILLKVEWNNKIKQFIFQQKLKEINLLWNNHGQNKNNNNK